MRGASNERLKVGTRGESRGDKEGREPSARNRLQFLAPVACLSPGWIEALEMSALGLLGVVALSMTQRTRELGIRLALGARGHQVICLVL